MSLNKTLTDRIDDAIEHRDGCWVWTRAKTPSGYSVITYQYKVYRAHRLVYEALVGPIPEGYTIDHLCHNKLCVNPKHLEAVTSAENTRRFNETRTHCKHGHEFTEANTYHPPKRPDRRHCIACMTKSTTITRKRG